MSRHGPRETEVRDPGSQLVPAAEPRAAGWGPQAVPEVDYALVRDVQRTVADRLTQARQARTRTGEIGLDPEEERKLTQVLIGQEVSKHVRDLIAGGSVPPGPDFDAQLAYEVEAAIFDSGRLQRLLEDPMVENIDATGCDRVFVTYADERGKVRGAPIAATDEEMIAVIRTLGSYSGISAKPFGITTPTLDVRLPDGSRLSATMGASPRPLLSIRRNRVPLVFLTDPPPDAHGGGIGSASGATGRGLGSPQPVAESLLDLGTLDAQLASFLRAAVLARCNIMIGGATDAGKTTLLRALINCIPVRERIITVEKVLELDLARYPHLHPDVAELEELLPDAEGLAGLALEDLVTRTLRMNPSRVIVGEVLGPEVMVMLSAMSQGNNGSLSTIHADSAAGVFTRLAMYATLSRALKPEQTNALSGSSLHFVVFVHKSPVLGDQRCVAEVLEVTGTADGQVIRSLIFSQGPDGRALRDQRIQIQRAALLARHGYDDSGWAPQWAPSSTRPQGGAGADTIGSPAGWAPTQAWQSGR